MTTRARARYELAAEDRSAPAFRSFKRNLREASQQFRAFKGTLLGAFSAGAAGLAIKRSIDLGDKIQKLSIQTGASTEALSQLAHASELAGVPFGNLSNSMVRMQRAVSEAARGTGQARDALRLLGLDAGKLKALKPEEQLEALADAFGQIENESERVELATRIMGRSGAEMLQLFEGGSAAIRAARNEADELGLTLSRAEADDMAAANDALTRLRGSWTGLANVIARFAAPALEAVAGFFTVSIPRAANYGAQAIATLKAAFYDFVSGAVDRMAEFSERLASVSFGGFAKQMERNAQALRLISREFGKRADEEVKVLAAAMKDLEERKTDELTIKTGNAFKDTYNPALAEAARNTAKLKIEARSTATAASAMTDEWDRALDLIDRQFAELDEQEARRIAGLGETNRAAADESADAWGEAGDRIKSNFTDDLRNAMSGGFEDIGRGWKRLLDDMAAQAITSQLSGLFNFGGGAGPAGGGIGGAVAGFFQKLIPRQHGGAVFAGQGYLVGERGPEAFFPGQSGRIVSDGGGAINVTNNFHISAPGGNVSRASQAQIAARAGEGINRALARNR